MPNYEDKTVVRLPNIYKWFFYIGNPYTSETLSLYGNSQQKIAVKIYHPHNHLKLNADNKSCVFVDPSHVGYEKQPQIKCEYWSERCNGE